MTGLFSRLKTVLGGKSEEADPLWWPAPSDEVRALVEAASEEDKQAAKESPPYGHRVRLTRMDAWRRILESGETIQVEVAVHAMQRNWGTGDLGISRHWRRDVDAALASHLVRRRLPFSAAQLAYFVTLGAHETHMSWGFPFTVVLSAAERFCAGQPPPAELAHALNLLKSRIESEWSWTVAGRKAQARIELMLAPELAEHGFALPDDPWANEAAQWIAGLTAGERTAWEELIAHAASAGDNSRPPKKWLNEAARLIAATGRAAVEDRVGEWLRETDPWASQLSDESTSVFKGLIWSCAHLDHADMAGPVGAFAARCFRKEPDWGPVSPRLGNACVLALGMMGDADEAAAELVRLKTKVRYDTVRGRVEDRLGAIAEEAGVTVADLEESTLPRFDMDDAGIFHAMLGDAAAIIRMEADGAVLSWHGPEGKPRKTVPAAVKRDHGAALKTLRQRVKEINAARKTQLVRLEASWIEGRDWPFDVWFDRYLGHPVRRGITRTLIWRFESPEGAVDAMPQEDGFVTHEGAPADPPAESRVRLWHPLDSGPHEVMAWRRRILDRAITQPIKQAHREIYVLTDAERETRDYSNRFAAHILRQHQFRALCHARGWRYDLQGAWDSWNVPTRLVPERDHVIEFHVEAIEDGELSEMDVPLHVATDRVRFMRGDREAIALADLPPVVFSEVMRDVDLFVSVTSVANDPAWTDGGPDGLNGGYWREHAFGELGETAKTRRELISAIAPKLTIADRLDVTDRFLEVQGNRHRYRIHLGSSNIQILPDNRYLCIVPGGKATTERGLRLPFDGDTLLSIILAKAFLLAADDEIADPTILSQLPK